MKATAFFGRCEASPLVRSERFSASWSSTRPPTLRNRSILAASSCLGTFVASTGLNSCKRVRLTFTGSATQRGRCSASTELVQGRCQRARGLALLGKSAATSRSDFTPRASLLRRGSTRRTRTSSCQAPTLNASRSRSTERRRRGSSIPSGTGLNHLRSWPMRCTATSCSCATTCWGWTTQDLLAPFTPWGAFWLFTVWLMPRSVASLDGAPLMIRGRSSHRVPFGTGAALKRILAASAKGEPYRVYAPDVFLQLKIALAALQLFCADRGREDPIQCLKSAAQMHQGVDAQQLHCELVNLGYLSALRHAQRISRDPATMLRHLHGWFDAFRTLKFVHRLTRIFPKVELLEAIRTARFVGNGSAQLEDLQQLRLALVDLERSRTVQVGAGSQCTSTSSVSRPPPTKMVPDVGVAST